MRRRTAILSLVAGAAALGAGGAAVALRPRAHPHLALDPMIDRLTGLRADAVETASAWDVARTFNHLAQGVEFSMSAYPELKSGLFRHTVGPAALRVFRARGAMRHDTGAVIPGEALDATTPDAARQRLIESLIAFRDWEAPLSPHFAYGALDKAAYAEAHAMHVHDHLIGFRAA